MHGNVLEFLAEAEQTFGPWDGVLEFGSLDLNGTARDAVPHRAWWGIDLQDGPGVDEVADARVWEPEDGAGFDVLVCTNVLEHAPDWPLLLARMVHVARQTGATHLLIQCAGPGFTPHSAEVIGPPLPHEHYRNVSATEIAAVLVEHGCDVVLARQGGWCGSLDSEVVAVVQ